MPNTPKKTTGFEESPQAEFEGAPYTGNVTDWVRELEQQAAKESRKAETREIRSKAGTHRVTVERKAQAAVPVDPNDAIRAANIKKATSGAKGPASAERSEKLKGGTTNTSAKTSRGTSIGASSDPKTRAAAGLNPIAGLEISLEEAEKLGPNGVTATVEALSALIESGNPLF